MQRILQSPRLQPTKLATLYFGIFLLYIILPEPLRFVRPALSQVMLALLVITGLSAFWRAFQN